MFEVLIYSTCVINNIKAIFCHFIGAYLINPTFTQLSQHIFRYQTANALNISYDIVSDTNSFYSNSTAALPVLGASIPFQNATELRDFSLKVTVVEGKIYTR